MALGKNILEQEDDLKGMPDSFLQMEMQMPSGRYPEFLVMSEVQRRGDMRQRFMAQQQEGSQPSVKEQMIASLSAASQVPPIPMASGGKAKSDFPDYSGDGKITKKDILIGRGVIPMDNGGGLSDAMRRSRSDTPSRMAESFTGPTDFLVQAATSYLISQGLDPSTYTVQELVEIGRQRAQDRRSFLPASVADEQMSTLGEVLEGSKNLLASALPDMPEMNLGASSADRQRRAGELADDLSRRADAVRESFTVDVSDTNLGRSPRGEGVESAVAGIADVGTDVIDELSRRGSAIAESFDLDVPEPLSQSDIDERNRRLELNRGILSSLDGLSMEEVRAQNEASDERIRQANEDILQRRADDLNALRQRQTAFFPKEPRDDMTLSELIFGREDAEPRGIGRGRVLSSAASEGGDPVSDSMGQMGRESGEVVATETTGNATVNNLLAQTNQLLGIDVDGLGVIRNQPASGAEKADAFRMLGVEDAPTETAATGITGSPLDEIADRSESLAKTRAEEISELIEANRAQVRNNALYAALAQIGAGIASGATDLGIGKGAEAAGKVMAAGDSREDLLRTQQMAAEDKDLERQIDFIKTRANIDLNERKLAAEIAANEDLQSRNQATRQSAVANVVNNIYDADDYADAEERKRAYVSLYNSLASAYSVPRLTVDTAQTGTTTAARSAAELREARRSGQYTGAR